MSLVPLISVHQARTQRGLNAYRKSFHLIFPKELTKSHESSFKNKFKKISFRGGGGAHPPC